jgi:hypothetical protein
MNEIEIKMEELRGKIVSEINEAELPPYFIELILSSIINEVVVAKLRARQEQPPVMQVEDVQEMTKTITVPLNDILEGEEDDLRSDMQDDNVSTSQSNAD